MRAGGTLRRCYARVSGAHLRLPSSPDLPSPAGIVNPVTGPLTSSAELPVHSKSTVSPSFIAKRPSQPPARCHVVSVSCHSYRRAVPTATRSKHRSKHETLPN